MGLEIFCNHIIWSTYKEKWYTVSVSKGEKTAFIKKQMKKEWGVIG